MGAVDTGGFGRGGHVGRNRHVMSRRTNLIGMTLRNACDVPWLSLFTSDHVRRLTMSGNSFARATPNKLDGRGSAVMLIESMISALAIRTVQHHCSEVEPNASGRISF